MSNRELRTKLIRSERLIHAYGLAPRSPDPRTQNGAVIFMHDECIGYGYNNFPSSVEVTPERLVAPLKYSYMEHAERNAIFNAYYNQESVAGATMYCPYAACTDCARAMIIGGIRTLIRHKDIMDLAPPKWRSSVDIADEMLQEAGIQIIEIEGHLGVEEIMFDGELRSF